MLEELPTWLNTNSGVLEAIGDFCTNLQETKR